MSPEQKLEWMRDKELLRELEDAKRIVQFEVHDYSIFVLLADGTLWKKMGVNEWERIVGP
jgi:hypothetical protein